MALKAGIVGLPNVGKSTLFNCLSSAKAQAANFPFCTIDAQMGQVSVPDERLTKLAELVHPGRIVPAVCDIVDIAGLVKGASKGEGLGNQFLGIVRALTIDEYRKHRSILPLTSKPYWLATGWTTNSSPLSDGYLAYSISTVGTVYNLGGVYGAFFAPRPALYLKSSILVSVETEDEGKALADYSDTDIIDELYRRRRSTYDPD